MKTYSYESDYGNVTCSFFFDADNNGGSNGIDISVDGKHVGEIWDTNIPDEDSEPEEIKGFEEGVDEWLSRNF